MRSSADVAGPDVRLDVPEHGSSIERLGDDALTDRAPNT
jgi:hypothetical protein